MRPMGYSRLENTQLIIWAHTAGSCTATVCSIHRRTEHPMRSFPQSFRGDRGLMERVCPHGIGHPDPDDLVIVLRLNNGVELVHGCDGCCEGSYS